MITRVILYCGKEVALVCDGNCSKAWGMNCRPKTQLSDDPDDYEYLSDDELGNAPVNPGTYEGGWGKPNAPENRLNKWCARECERSKLVSPHDGLVELKNFKMRLKNRT